ncbi:hypothetical protein BS47DRAFT_115827 [Hydnum rufescens UP504]|uniref:Secreted protein n=1 Tax=Hydnum rufescens UP504 TaxID=1448309 RepID=A0A9P6APW1_9AGAM|nr:hypothetical protein BS47DRAFT_115827 [Hydnum rufescens UP504]
MLPSLLASVISLLVSKASAEEAIASDARTCGIPEGFQGGFGVAGLSHSRNTRNCGIPWVHPALWTEIQLLRGPGGRGRIGCLYIMMTCFRRRADYTQAKMIVFHQHMANLQCSR